MASVVLYLMKDEKSLNEFLKNYYNNSYNAQEHQLFIDWLNNAPVEQVEEILEMYQRISEEQIGEESVQYPELVQGIEAKLDQLNEVDLQSAKTIKLWPSYYKKIASVAAIFLMVTAFILFLTINPDYNQTVSVKPNTQFRESDTSPGGNKAILNLANGSKIILDNAKTGVLANQFGVSVRKAEDGHVIFDKTVTQYYTSYFDKQASLYNTIITPRGGQYKVTLPDGTKVWLNAASSLKFPASFTGKERNVELNGEAYFEVAKCTSLSSSGDKVSMPFKVTSGIQVVEVLGTHFNIKGYPDETVMTTTLLEGSVKVSQRTTPYSQLLKPGQQAKVGNGIQVLNVDPMQAIAWKNGYFDFSHENIESIMRNISRWYDVDIKYENNITKEGFVGSVSRYQNVAQVLNMLQLTGSVHFKIEGRRITVMP